MENYCAGSLKNSLLSKETPEKVQSIVFTQTITINVSSSVYYSLRNGTKTNGSPIDLSTYLKQTKQRIEVSFDFFSRLNPSSSMHPVLLLIEHPPPSHPEAEIRTLRPTSKLNTFASELEISSTVWSWIETGLMRRDVRRRAISRRNLYSLASKQR